MRAALEQAAEILRESTNIVFLGGAGVSTASGIPDFRSAAGLYSRNLGLPYPPEVILSREFFQSRPAQFYDFLREYLVYPDAKPNLVHKRLAAWEREGHLKAVITQNIDGLHQAAGSGRVLELHGNLDHFYCLRCRKAYGLSFALETKGVPVCPACGGIVRPDVVLYGENVKAQALNEGIAAIREADALLVCGTSLQVYPAAGLVRYYSGAKMILVNQDPTPFDSGADYLIQMDLTAAFQAFEAGQGDQDDTNAKGET